MVDVCIIGGGVVGGLIARELSKYNLNICLLEKDSDVSMGTSKANSGIVHAGFDAETNTLKAKLNVKGTNMMEKISKELDVSFKKNGSLVIAFNDDELKHINILKDRGIKNGVLDLHILNGTEVKKLEPNISDNVKGALLAKNSGIISPYELTIASIGNAMDNGLELKLNFCVKSIENKEDYFIIYSDNDSIKSKYIINCAGLYSDTIANMISDNYFNIQPRKGEYLLLDKKEGNMVEHTIFQVPSTLGKGVLVTQTVDGNLLLGPTSEDINQKDDFATTDNARTNIIENAMRSIPNINIKSVITSFTGIRACSNTRDFIIEKSKTFDRFIHVAGIQSPGLSASPAIACYVIDLLKTYGLDLVKKDNFNPFRKNNYGFRKMNDDEKNNLISQNKKYGKIICRCEEITEGEIIEAIHKNPPALNLDAIKRRTRSTMGRCQGGFCTPQILEILALELNIPIEDATKFGLKSNFIIKKTK